MRRTSRTVTVWCARLSAAVVGVIPMMAASEPAVSPAVLGPEGTTLRSEARPLTAGEVTKILFQADRTKPIDFSGRIMRYLDLSGLDFKGASLDHADLFGTDLSTANLKGADLHGAILNRTVIIKADFSGANLSGATFMRPNVSTSLDYDASEEIGRAHV